MKKVFVAVALLATLSCSAQNIPAVVKSAFANNFPRSTVKKWDEENGKYEANFKKDNKNMSAVFDAAGVLEETETDIKVSELPVAVTDYVKANYQGTTIKEAAIIIKQDGKKMYEAEVKGKDLLFDEQGTFLREEKEED